MLRAAAIRHRRPAVVAVSAVLTFLLFASPASADGPQFLDSGPAVVAESTLADPGFTGLSIEVVNPDATQELEVRVRVTGEVADALVVKAAGTTRIPPGGSAVFTLIRGPRPHAGTGEVVVIAAGGVARRPLEVTAPPTFWQTWWPALGAGFLAVAMVVVMVVVLTRRRRREGSDDIDGPMAPEEEPSESDDTGFLHPDEPAKVDGWAERTSPRRSSASPGKAARLSSSVCTESAWAHARARRAGQIGGPTCAHQFESSWSDCRWPLSRPTCLHWAQAWPACPAVCSRGAPARHRCSCELAFGSVGSPLAG